MLHQPPPAGFPMKLRPDTLAMTATLALLTSLGPLSTDMYLPSLPGIAAEFGTTIARVQLTLSAFLIGFAAGQIVYGPLSDRYGRRPLLFAGLAIFSAGSALCALAPDVDTLIGGRVLQALGASGPIVLARAMVRDLYEGARAGRELSRMGTIMGVVPAIAPILGSFIEVWSGWRMTFWLTLALGLGLALLIGLRLPETLRMRNPEPLSLPGIFRGFGKLLENRTYRVYVLIAAFTYAGLFAFISGSSFVLQGVYGLNEMGFAISFAIMVAGYIAGTLLAQRFVGTYGLQKIIGAGVACQAGGGLAMLAGVAIASSQGLLPSLAVTAPMTLYALGVGLTLPQTQASAMAPFPERAGAASSFLGLCQMLFAAIVGVMVGHALGASAWPLAIAIAVTGLAAFGVFAASANVRNAN